MPKPTLCVIITLLVLMALLCGGAWYTELISVRLTRNAGLTIQHLWSRDGAVRRWIPAAGPDSEGAGSGGSSSRDATLDGASALTGVEVQALVQAAAEVALAVAAAAANPTRGGGESGDGESQGQGCKSSGFCSLGKVKEWTGAVFQHGACIHAWAGAG
jgi:hypothetical protein